MISAQSRHDLTQNVNSVVVSCWEWVVLEFFYLARLIVRFVISKMPQRCFGLANCAKQTWLLCLYHSDGDQGRRGVALF